MKRMRQIRGILQASLFSVLFAVGGCDSPPPEQQTPNLCAPDTPASPSCKPFSGSLSSCKCSNEDYAPRYNGSKNDTWPSCISDADPNKYVQLGTSTSAASRTKAFQSMGALLWKKGTPPTATDFTQARDSYAVDQGIGSRVARRQDIHYPEVPGSDKFACSTASVAAQYPDRCAGPGKLKPIIDQAFVDGIAGNKPRVQAARIEAALLWFFYLSTLSEEWTSSFDNMSDVDSACGYLVGGVDRSSPLGLGEYIRQLDTETYDRAFDGVLAGRCWRDFDKALPATCGAFYSRVNAQLDKALQRGLALILRDRLSRISGLSGEEQEAAIAFVNVFGGLLDRAVRALDATKADQLKTTTQATALANMNISQAQGILDTLFACP
ncbi:MAG TPA: hypothetical protein PKE31_05390 [Pseudomonadota bacterium]|nr:hypothetical protein [Pseudomonadota bacterium]